MSTEMMQPTQNFPILSQKLEVFVTRDPKAVAAAQRLRYQIFAEEMGASLPDNGGLDIDHYDAFCEHLIARDRENGLTVGTYRLITEQAAQAAGGWYSANEFDIGNIEHLMPNTVELGRACVHPSYRSGTTISLLWMGLSRFMQTRKLQYMVGCASVGMEDGGHRAASLFRILKQQYFAPSEYRVYPKIPLPLDRLRQDLTVEAPALLKGYLKAGVWICSEPYWDKDFNTADMLVMMPLNRINPRYAKHFLK